MSELAHLRVYRFDPGAVFEGGLLAAIERVELGKDGKLLDALFVRRDAASGALEAVDLGVGGADATFASLLDFRLDSGRRRALTERTLAEHRGGVPRPLIEAIAATLEAGAAIFAVLQTGPTATVLEDAVRDVAAGRSATTPSTPARWRRWIRGCARPWAPRRRGRERGCSQSRLSYRSPRCLGQAAGGLSWALVWLASAVLAVAAVSRRLSGTPVSPAMLFVLIGVLVGPEVV